MRVVQYISYFPPHVGGLESHAAQWAKRWMKSGSGDCLVATYSIGQPTTITYQHDQITVVVIPAFEIIPTFPFPKFWTSEYRQAHRLIKEFAPDILITRTRFFLASLLGGIFAKRHRIKRVHIEHGVEYVHLGVWRKNSIAWLYDQLIGRWIFRFADEVVGISNGCSAFIRRFTHRKVAVIYRGVDTMISSTPHTLTYPIQLGYVGRLTALKDVRTLVEACAILRHKQFDFILSIVGDGEERRALEQQVHATGLQDRIQFLGYRDQTYLANEFYPQMHIIINCSVQEGLPTSVIEGLLAGCVVVATDVGGTPEISNAADLILVPSGDAQALANGLICAQNQRGATHGRSEKEVRDKFLRSKNILLYKQFNCK